jgi:hypothetical protein
MTYLARLATWTTVVALLAGPAATRAGPTSQAAEDSPYIGISLATIDSRGQWSGRWLGAHLWTREGATYLVAMAGPSWAVLQDMLRTDNRGAFYLLGDLPYAGDGVCAPGTLRRWWRSGELIGDGTAMTWEPATVPAGAPAPPCPQNLPSEAPLVLQAVPQ